MFSFVALAKPGGHRTNIYNTLAASAFLILWYDPFFIMSVGFQLSYLAVLGIVYIQPGLYHLWNPSNRILDEIWKVTCVSVAAQVATFSLGLLYFHQFPNYFLVSNLFAIPGSFGILVLGLATLAASFLSPVASTLGLLLEWIIKALNAIMFIMEDLPFIRVENVYITPLQCWILIGLLLAVLLLHHTRKFVWVKMICFLGVIFSGLQWYHYHRDVNIRQLTVYNIAGHTAVDLIENGKAYFIADSSLRTLAQKVDFHVSSNRIKCGVKRIYSGVELQENRRGCSIIVWSNHSVLQIHEPEFRLPEKVRVDFVIISNDALTNVEEFTKQISANRLILDSSNSRFNVSKLMRQGVNNDIEIYSVADQGAYELKI
jgi:competence protein ComEC